MSFWKLPAGVQVKDLTGLLRILQAREEVRRCEAFSRILQGELRGRWFWREPVFRLGLVGSGDKGPVCREPWREGGVKAGTWRRWHHLGALLGYLTVKSHFS